MIKATEVKKKGNGFVVKFENGQTKLYDVCYFDGSLEANQEVKAQTKTAKEMSKDDFDKYLKTKPTQFLKGLEKTGLNALGSERHQQVVNELAKRYRDNTSFEEFEKDEAVYEVD